MTLLFHRFAHGRFHCVVSEPVPCARCKSCHVLLVHHNAETLCLYCSDKEELCAPINA